MSHKYDDSYTGTPAKEYLYSDPENESSLAALKAYAMGIEVGEAIKKATLNEKINEKGIVDELFAKAIANLEAHRAKPKHKPKPVPKPKTWGSWE